MGQFEADAPLLWVKFLTIFDLGNFKFIQ